MNGQTERVVLVDARGEPIGEADKLCVHRGTGQRHLAVSVFVLDSAGRIVLQRRAPVKYHFAGLWSNTCCTHVRPGEDVLSAGERRVMEEMGLAVRLRHVGAFEYRARCAQTGLWEHEYDHVLVGYTDAEPGPDAAEVDAWRRVAPADLRAELAADRSRFTPWLAPALDVLTARGC